MAKHVNSMKQNYFANWHELDDKSKVDLEDAWLQKEMKGEEPNSSVRLQLHKEFMREALGLTEVNDYPKSYNDVLKAWLIDQGESGKSLPSLLKEYWEDAEALAFQTLGPRLDGAISTEVQRGTGGHTFTRASDAMVRDWENVFRTVPSGEARIQGARRVENHIKYSEDLTNAVWTKQTNVNVEKLANGVYSVDVTSAAANTGVYQTTNLVGDYTDHTVTLSIELKADVAGILNLADASGSSNNQDLNISTEWKRYSFTFNPTSASSVGFWIRTNNPVSISKWYVRSIQTEDVSGQTDTAPGPYVSRDVPTGPEGFISMDSATFAGGGGASDWTYDATKDTYAHVPTGTATLVFDYDLGDLAIPLTVGEKYRVEWEVVSISIGTLSVQVAGANGAAQSSVGTYVEYLTAALGNNSLNVYSATVGDGEFKIHSISKVDDTGVKYFYDSPIYTVTSNIVTDSGNRLVLHPTKYKLGAKVFETFTRWQASTAYSVGDRIIPLTGSGPAGGNGYYYLCTTAGTSDSSEPTFGTTIDGTTADNTATWTCKGYYTIAGYHAEPQRTNELTYSYDLTNWTGVGTPTPALDETGIDGVANKATTVNDNDGASHEYLYITATIPDDSNTNTAQFWIEKDNDETRFPECTLYYTGGATKQNSIQINTKTGEANQRVITGGATGTYGVEDKGLWWAVNITLDNDSTGNVTARLYVYPSVTDVIGTANVAATGSIVVGHTQLELNTSVPSSPIETNGATVTRSEDLLMYQHENMLEGVGTNLVTHTIVQGAPTLTILGNATTRMFPGMYQVAVIGNQYRVRSYDASSADVTSASAGTYTYDPTKLNTHNAGVHWSTDSGEFESGVSTKTGNALTGGVSYDGTFHHSVDIRILNNGVTTVVGFVRNIMMYNKDLGSTKLGNLLNYD